LRGINKYASITLLSRAAASFKAKDGPSCRYPMVGTKPMLNFAFLAEEDLTSRSIALHFINGTDYYPQKLSFLDGNFPDFTSLIYALITL
jgi:hypothetical protein